MNKNSSWKTWACVCVAALMAIYFVAHVVVPASGHTYLVDEGNGYAQDNLGRIWQRSAR